MKLLKLTTLVFVAAILLISCSGGNDAGHNITIYSVSSAVSVSNIFAGIVLPRNPGMAENNWSGGHQDSYCSESVGLSGPTGSRLKVIEQYNPYGFTPVMACNSNNQMMGVSLEYGTQTYRLIVFDKDLQILTANRTAEIVAGTFGGGYFFMNSDDNAVVVGENKMKCFPTANVENRGEVYELSLLWESDDIVALVTGSTDDNSLYATLPVWDPTRPNLYWCLIAGKYDFQQPGLINPAYIAVVEVVPDADQPSGATTRLMDSMELTDQWNNNTLAVDEDGVYFVTNGVDATGNSTWGLLHAFRYDAPSESLEQRWSYSYKNCGILKTGLKNIGSGTTPSIMVNRSNGKKYVTFDDNDDPKFNVVVVDQEDGSLVAEMPVFPDQRGCDEASFIAVDATIVAENNFGHTANWPESQLVPNEPGMVRIDIDPQNPGDPATVVWEDDQDCFFAMSMLCRESGIIFAHTGDWNDALSATLGAIYQISAMDSYDGQVFWSIPLGRGVDYCHEYGGLYFDREGDLYVGTNQYLFTIKNEPTGD
jgi:hypothetical protein